MRKISPGRTAPIVVTASLAGAFLLAALGLQLGEFFQLQRDQTSLSFSREGNEGASVIRERDAWRDELARLGMSATSSDAAASSTIPDLLASQFLEGYIALKQYGVFTGEGGRAAGERIGALAKAPLAYAPHGEKEIQPVADTSPARVLQYRSDMRVALTTLLSDAPPEFETFARYIETKNPLRLDELREAAERYREAEKLTLAVVVPKKGAAIHLRVANALGAYAAALDQLVQSADSPLSSLAVLRTYNEAEREMLYAFDALSQYYVRASKE